MKISVLVVPLMFAASVLAQAEAEANKPTAGERLQEQLRTAATVSSAEFDVAWKWPVTARGTATTTRSGGGGEERVSGRIYRNAVLFEVAKPRLGSVQVLQVGRHTIARANQDDWQLDSLAGARAIRVSYLPDPQRLLLALAAAKPEVSNREIVDVDGRAVERVGVTLDAAQTEVLVRSGVLHEPNVMAAMIHRGRGGAGMPKAEATPIDVVIEFDVRSKHVLAVRFRAIVAAVDIRALIKRARNRRVGGEEKEEEPAKEAGAEAGPVRFQDGMPVRDAKGKTVLQLELLLRKHGKLPALELSAAQKKLLGL